MSASPLPYRIFGLPMQRRSARRRLVVVAYAGLAAVSAVTFLLCLRSSSWMFSLVIYGACGVGAFVFGGQGRYGLIKCFLNKPPRPEPSRLGTVKLDLNPPDAQTLDQSDWRNDERELAVRDRAHYVAYQPLILGTLLVLLFSAWALHPPRFVKPRAMLPLLLLVGIAGVVLSITLPAALILWNEPDMIPELEEVSL